MSTTDAPTEVTALERLVVAQRGAEGLAALARDADLVPGFLCWLLRHPDQLDARLLLKLAAGLRVPAAALLHAAATTADVTDPGPVLAAIGGTAVEVLLADEDGTVLPVNCVVSGGEMVLRTAVGSPLHEAAARGEPVTVAADLVDGLLLAEGATRVGLEEHGRPTALVEVPRPIVTVAVHEHGTG